MAKTRSPRSIWKKILYPLASIYITLLLVTIFLADKIIFRPPPISYSESISGFKYLTNADQQKVAISYTKAKAKMPTILWSHGNAEDLAAAQSYLIQLQKQGFGTLIYDYPGYGLSDGKPSENGCYQNISAAWKHLTQELAIPENEIFIVGRSIGSGPSTWLAEKNNPAGLALISPFKSINRVPFTINPFPYDRFPNIKKMKNVSSKLLIIHGDQDNVIGLSHGKAIYNKHQGDKKFINAKGYGHNDILNSKQVNTALSEFFLPRNLPAR